MAVGLLLPIFIGFLGMVALVISVTLAFVTLGNIEDRERDMSISMGQGAAWSSVIALILLILAVIAVVIILGRSISYSRLKLLVTNPDSLINQNYVIG